MRSRPPSTLKDRGLDWSHVLRSHRGVEPMRCDGRRRSPGSRKCMRIIGGFHLAPYPPGVSLAETLIAAKGIDPDYLVPLHCTGEPFLELAKGVIPGRKSSEPTPALVSTSRLAGGFLIGCLYRSKAHGRPAHRRIPQRGRRRAREAAVRIGAPGLLREIAWAGP